MSELQLVNDRLSALINSLSPSARKQMARKIAKKLRASQQQNIKRQQAPDGTPFKPRKAQPVRGKKGRIKREMFAKLRTAKYMIAKSSSDEAEIGFIDRVQRMAQVHHYGLNERPSKHSREVRYVSRPLLGLNKYAIDMIEEVIINAIED